MTRTLTPSYYSIPNVLIVEDIPFNVKINEEYFRRCHANIVGIANNG